ncbi:MAG: CoA pyrophosphatase [Oscillospiraceae bacterium]|nr:CoA pyrophosphatase [Oscillospiraceae bacterium]
MQEQAAAIAARLAAHEPVTWWLERPRRVAVLLPLLWKDGGWQVLFQVRAARIAQPGEVCFPGGHLEPGETPAQAAVREVCEELCVRPEQLRLLGEGDRVLTPAGVEVYPFVGVLSDYAGTFSGDEVAETFTVPLDWLKQTPPLQAEVRTQTVPGEDFPYHLIPGGRDYPWGRAKYGVLFWQYGEKVIWGLTAKVLHRMLPLL